MGEEISSLFVGITISVEGARVVCADRVDRVVTSNQEESVASPDPVFEEGPSIEGGSSTRWVWVSAGGEADCWELRVFHFGGMTRTRRRHIADR